MNIHAYNIFHDLHFSDQPLLLRNIWDAPSAVLEQLNGAKAIATGSASLAWANGYADGGHLPVHVLFAAVSNIARVVSVPLSVDIEDGYASDVAEVVALVKELVNLGVVGINIEDGVNSPDLLANKIEALRQAFGHTLFINARTDVYLRSLVDESAAEDEVLKRVHEYIEAGADCIFIPGLNDIRNIKRLAKHIEEIRNTPLNIMLPHLDDVAAYMSAGARRFSCGPFPFLKAYQHAHNRDVLDFDLMNQIMLKRT